MTEEDCFLKAICEEPDEQTHRLVYADWLDDRNEKPELVKQIRNGYETCAYNAWCAEQPGAWRVVHNREVVPRNTGAWIDKALKPFDGLLKSDGSAYIDGTLIFRGGFLDSVTIGVHKFFENVSLFGKHPVRNIRLSDFRARPDFARNVARRYIVYVHNLSLQHDRTLSSNLPTYLPPEFNDLLRGELYGRAYSDRQYTSEKEALRDVAQACAAYARRHYGWPSRK